VDETETTTRDDVVLCDIKTYNKVFGYSLPDRG
jgi:hypothetical protein